MALLIYLRRKLIVSMIRLALWITKGSPKAFPDDVLQLPSRDIKRTIKAHLYKPKSYHQPGPVLINFHGSGWVLPMHGSDDKFCRKVSQETDYTVLDIRYRLAPEEPFPAAVHDAEDVVRWVLERPDEFDRNRIAMSGFSAGGTLALVASACIFPKGTIRTVVVFYPPTDFSIGPGEKVAPDPSGRPIPASLARLFDECYIPPTASPNDPRVSPSFASPDSFPANVMILTVACDTLAMEAEALATRIEAVPGHRVVRRRYEKCSHEWDKVGDDGSVQAKARDEAYASAVEMLGF